MKIRASVLTVDDCGDTITVTLQGRAARGAEWRSYLKIEMQLPATTTAKRAYYLGRDVNIEVGPR